MARSPSRPDAATTLRGAIGGLGAFLVGYVLTYAWRAPAVNESLQGLNFLAELFGIEAIPTWKGVAWLFYGAHGVTTRFPTPGGTPEMINLVEQSGDGTVVLLYLLVPVLLLLAGALTAWLGEAGETAEAAAAGATVTMGYFIVAAAGTFLFSHSIGDIGASIAPDPVTGVLLAGLVYPIVFGAVGGALSSYR